MKALFLVLISLFFIGCAPSTFNEMKTRDDIKKSSFTVNEGYEIVYKRSLSKARECYEFGAVTAAFIAEGQLYHDSKEAEITVSMIGGTGRNVIHGATIKETADRQTKIDLYTYWSDKYLVQMKKLFSGESTACN